MIKVAYTNIESKIKINSLLSDPLTVIQVCQGCQLSILLYIIEPFSLKMYTRSAKTYDFCMFVWLVFMYALLSTRVCFHLKSNVHIVRTFENRIPFQTFEKWHNVSYHYVSYISQKYSILKNSCMVFKASWREG